MDKLKYIKIKQEDGTYSEEVPVGVDASNVDMSDGRTLPETLGLIDVDANGTVKQQLDELNKNKVDKNSYSSKVSELENKNIEQDNIINQKVNQSEYNIKMSDLEIKNRVQDAQISQMIANPGESTEGNSELLDIRIGADSSVYDTSGNAVRKQITFLEDLNKDILFKNSISKNLFNYLTFTENKEINSNGDIVDNFQDFGLSDYINVNSGKTIYFSTKDKNALSGIGFCYGFNMKNEMVARFIIQESYLIPSNVKKIRICIPNSYKNICQVEYDSITNYTEYKNFSDLLLDFSNMDLSLNKCFQPAEKIITSFTQLPSLAEAELNRIYLIGVNDDLPDLPEKNHYGVLLTFSPTLLQDSINQIFITPSGYWYFRTKFGLNNNFSSWKKMLSSQELLSISNFQITNSNKVLDDINDAEVNTIYCVAGTTINNTPKGVNEGSFFSLNSLPLNTGGNIMFFLSTENILYSRIRWGSGTGTWSDWKQINYIPEINFYEKMPDSLYWCFNTVGIIGDSLASGAEYNTDTEEWEFPIEGRWGYVLSQHSGKEYKYFSVGGETTRGWLINSTTGYPEASKIENLCSCYIIGLGENDVNRLGSSYLGTVSDINLTDEDLNSDSYYGNYGKIIQKMKKLVPKAKFFLLTNPYNETGLRLSYNNAVREISNVFDNCYLIDLAVNYKDEFNSGFINDNRYGGHYSAQSYYYMGEIIKTELNKIIWDNPTEFFRSQFIL